MHFINHKFTKKNEKVEQKNIKKGYVIKNILIMTLFSKFIRNFAKYASFYKETL